MTPPTHNALPVIERLSGAPSSATAVIYNTVSTPKSKMGNTLYEGCRVEQ